MRGSWTFRLSALALSLAAGCGATLADPPGRRQPVVEKGGEQLSRGVIQESLDTLDTPHSRAQLGRILNSSEVRDAVRDLSASVVIGVADGVRSAMQGQGEIASNVGSSFDDAMDRHLTPAVGRLAHRVVGSALDASLTDPRLSRIQLLGQQTTHAAVSGLAQGMEQDLGPALAATIERDIGPALALVIERDLLPAVARGLDTPQMEHAVSSLAHSIAAEFVTGAGEAIEGEVNQRQLSVFGNKIAVGYAVSVFLAFALGTLSIVLIVVLIRNSRRLRELTADAAQRRDPSRLEHAAAQS